MIQQILLEKLVIYIKNKTGFLLRILYKIIFQVDYIPECEKKLKTLRRKPRNMYIYIYIYIFFLFVCLFVCLFCNFEVGNYILNKTLTVQTEKKNTGSFEFNIVETSVYYT